MERVVKMIQIHIEPFDTLFFRDSRSFTAKEASTAEFSFPSPLTFFGAIGNAVLENTKHIDKNLFSQKESGKKVVHPKLGRYNEELNLEDTYMKLKGPFLRKGDQVFFPPPANLWISGTKPFYVSERLLPYEKEWLEGKKWLWDLSKKDLRPLKIPDDKNLKPLNQLISIDFLVQYLNGNLELLSAKLEDEFFSREIRYGHAISEDSKTHEESFLYSAPHLRFTDEVDYGLSKYIKSGFTLVAEGIDECDFEEKTISLGGERRKATITFDKNILIPEMPEILEKIKANKRFFIYFVTPSIFKNGWCIDIPLEFDGAKLVGAAVSKPLYTSGWINSEGKPRPIKKVVPSGSVYFFEAYSWDDEKFEEIYKKYNFGISFSSIYPAAGFGIGLLGSW